MTTTLTQEALEQFCGSAIVYRHPLYGPIRYTEGVRAVMQWGKARWLTDIIATTSKAEPLRRESMLVWTLTRGHSLGEGWWTAVLHCTDGDDKPLLFPGGEDDSLVEQRDFSMTDFPLETITIWVIDQVMMLPGEY